MKYLKVFETQAEESAWKESEEYIKTSLSMDKENMDELSYNSKVKFRAEYEAILRRRSSQNDIRD